MRRHCSGLKALPSLPSHPTSFRILGVFAMLKRSARAIPPFNLGYKSRAVGSLRRRESTECDRDRPFRRVLGCVLYLGLNHEHLHICSSSIQAVP